MELEGATQGLAALKRPCRVLLRLDSLYVKQGIEQLQRGVRFSDSKKNSERWAALAIQVQRHDVRMVWVKGHAGDRRNERVDRAANDQANGFVTVTAPVAAVSGGPVWSLGVISPGSDRPARWALRAEGVLRRGEVSVAKGAQAAAVYRALLAGMAAAGELPRSSEATLAVLTNFELLVKQCLGEWRVKDSGLQPLAADVARLRTGFGAVAFEHRRAEALADLFGGT
jgi:ribonuclease HI